MDATTAIAVATGIGVGITLIVLILRGSFMLGKLDNKVDSLDKKLTI